MANPKTPDSLQYWATLEDQEAFGRKVLERVDKFADLKIVNGVNSKHARAYQYYFGMDPSGVHATSQVLRGGDQGELAEIRVNHARPLVNTLLNLIVAPKLVWSPKATNIDYESLRECDVAAAVLEYYWKEKSVSRYAVRALEEALVFSEGFVLVEWRDDAGEVYAAELPEETAPIPPSEAVIEGELVPPGPALPAVPEIPWGEAKPVKTGDLLFHNVPAWDVIRDTSKQSYDELDWVMVRRWINKYDLAAQYPDKAEQIHHAPAELKDGDKNATGRDGLADTDDIPVYFFWHKVTPACPQGREAVVLGNGVTLHVADMEYGEIPLYRVSAGELFGTPFGYTPFLDILGIQELMDSLHTAVASNQSTFATQCIAMPDGSEIQPDHMAGGMKVIYYPPDGKPPEALQLTKSPPEVFGYLDSLKKHQELVFGLNSVVRGEAQSGEMSGSALALLQSQALQQSSVTQSNWLRMVESIGSCVIELFRKRATMPLKIALAGKTNASLTAEQEIGKDSFTRIRRVHVDIGNPLSQTSAGRGEIAKDMMNLGLVQTPEQYQEVLLTGRLEMMTQGMHHELLLIRGENEQLAAGEIPPVIDTDNHLLHGQEHKAVLANPQVRKNPKLVQAVLMHLQEHQVALMTTDPGLLMLVGLQPPAPMGAPPGGPEGEAGPGAPPQMPGNPNAGSAPQMPEPPTNPASGQKWNPVDGGASPPGGTPAR